MSAAKNPPPEDCHLDAWGRKADDPRMPETRIATPPNPKPWWKPFFLLVQLFCVPWILWWIPYDHLPAPGYGVAVLAIAAAVMSIEKGMKDWQKIFWIVIMAAMLITELRAISKEHDKAHWDGVTESHRHEVEEAIQNDRFHAAMEQSRDIISQVNGVLKTTQSVATLSESNLNNITGSTSFGYLVPSATVGAQGYSVNLYNGGSAILSGITVRISKVLGDRGGEENYFIDRTAIHAIPMNTLGPKAHALLPDYWIFPADKGVINEHFIAIISAQNGDALQDIYFRPALKGTGYAYRFTVRRSGTNGRFKLLKSQNWTEPTPL